MAHLAKARFSAASSIFFIFSRAAIPCVAFARTEDRVEISSIYLYDERDDAESTVCEDFFYSLPGPWNELTGRCASAAPEMVNLPPLRASVDSRLQRCALKNANMR
jgi:hypothetical protein